MCEVKSKKILIVANKSWEVDPLINVILNQKARPEEFGGFEIINYPLNPDEKKQHSKPRIKFKYNIFYEICCNSLKDLEKLLNKDKYESLCSLRNKKFKEKKFETLLSDLDFCRDEIKIILDKTQKQDGLIEIWCVQDLMDPKSNSSSTEEKIRILPVIFEKVKNPDYIIAFGTAGFPDITGYNGSVVIGTQVFVHNPYENMEGKSLSNWTDPRLDTLILSSLTNMPKGFWNSISPDARFLSEGRFLVPPMNPDRKPTIFGGDKYVSIGIVNVTDYDDYVWADHKGIDKYKEAGINYRIGSIETTHGIIRLVSEDIYKKQPSFFFVSGITDRLGYFDNEVTTRVYAQNFVAAHNAGVATSWIIPELFEL